MSRLLVLIALFAGLITGGGSYADIVESEGVAVLGAGLAVSREFALRDALRQAALNKGVSLASTDITSHGTLVKGSRGVSPFTSRLVEVLEEKEEDGLFRIRIRAEVTPVQSLQTKLKKRIGATWFAVADPIHVQDLNSPSKGLPDAFLKRLSTIGGYILPIDETIPVLPNTHEGIKELARRSRSQFLIAGNIINTGIEPGRFFEKDRRRIEIELSLYDGLTGALIAKRFFSEIAVGNVNVGYNKPFGSQSFFATETGKAFERLIESASSYLDAKIASLPFAANVIRADENRVFIDAGNLSGLNPGDSLIVYSRSGQSIDALNGQQLGVVEEAVASANIIQTQPDFSIAILDSLIKKQGVKVGDIVRFP
jgi:hypothetical protein